jgi:Flp pilus assembly protein TadD
LHITLGIALRHQGRTGEALAALRKATELDPRRAMGFSNLGLVLSELGRSDEANAAWRKVTELDAEGDGAAGYHSLGLALDSLGRSEEAVAAYRRTIELDPRATGVRYNLGIALYLLGKWEEAVAAYRRAIELQPNWAPPHGGLGFALAHLGRPGEALAAYRRAIELDPDAPDIWNHMATLWAQARDRAAYRGHCRRILDRYGRTTDPLTAERTAKACLLLPLGGPEQEAACDLADRAVAMAQDHWVRPWAEATRGLAAFRRGRFADAVAWADRCLSRGPGDWNREIPAHLVRAMALARLGRLDEARVALARASDLYQTKVANPGGQAAKVDWHDRVTCEVLRREAEAHFLDRDFPADPFAR